MGMPAPHERRHRLPLTRQTWERMDRCIAAEFMGTAILVTAIVGAGVMGTRLSQNLGLALLITVVSVVMTLGVLIWVIAPISGAHLNPVITLVSLFERQMRWPWALAFMAAQFTGALAGVALANLMFEKPAYHVARTQLTGWPIWLGEIIATAGLVFVVGAVIRTKKAYLAPILVAAWVGGACFFTSSTSFANPAVTLARAFSDTFAGIALSSVPMFIVVQLIGAAIGALFLWIFYDPRVLERQAAK